MGVDSTDLIKSALFIPKSNSYTLYRSSRVVVSGQVLVKSAPILVMDEWVQWVGGVLQILLIVVGTNGS